MTKNEKNAFIYVMLGLDYIYMACELNNKEENGKYFTVLQNYFTYIAVLTIGLGQNVQEIEGQVPSDKDFSELMKELMKEKDDEHNSPSE